MSEIEITEVKKSVRTVLANYDRFYKYYSKIRMLRLWIIAGLIPFLTAAIYLLGIVGISLVIPTLCGLFILNKNNAKLVRMVNINVLTVMARNPHLENTLIPPSLLTRLHPFIGGVHGVTFSELEIFANMFKNNGKQLEGATSIIRDFSI